jgi:uncharacterized protein (TIGR02757 family)
LNLTATKKILDANYEQFSNHDFIIDDPISIPHRFTQKQDIEISGFFAAMFSWGLRKTIINKSLELMQLFDNAPHQFVTQHEEVDLKRMLGFKHRTFNDTDLLYFISFFKSHYANHASLEAAFCIDNRSMYDRLVAFNNYFFSMPYLQNRTRKHVSTPANKSACKRLNMYFRWMVRNSNEEIDFGIWKSIDASELIIPLDVHVLKVANQLGLVNDTKHSWDVALRLTNELIKIEPNDPVKYDFALFGLGVLQKNIFKKAT